MISGPVSLIGGNRSTDRPAAGALLTRADSNLIQLAEYRPWKLPSGVDGSPTGPRGVPGKKDHASFPPLPSQSIIDPSLERSEVTQAMNDIIFVLLLGLLAVLVPVAFFIIVFAGA